jgi:hypothetical protein
MSTLAGSLANAAPPGRGVEEFLAELVHEFPDFHIVRKRHSGFSRILDVLLRVVTLNGMRTFMTHYHTVIGSTLYVPETWERLNAVDKLVLLRHERVHLRQRRRLTFLGMAFVYLIPWFPVGLAYGRARLEWEAYAETIRATHELLGPKAAHDPALRARIIGRFCSADYAWMWPFRGQLNHWYDQVLRELQPDATR